jgi:mono/diheme cytochrome c family protein
VDSAVPRPTRGLLLLVGAFLATRGLWILAAPETGFYWEEMYRWVVARELIQGAVQSLSDYQADHYQGGSLFMSVLAVPVFALLGESTALLKTTSLLLSTSTLVLLVLVARRGFGPEAGWLAGLGYLAGPPLVAFWGLVPLGSHGESVLFTLAQVGLLWRLLDEDGRTELHWLIFGVAAGLGFWWTPTTAIGVAACGSVFLLLAGLPRARELGAGLLGAALGLLPWLLYNVPRGFVGLGRVFDLLGAGDPINLWPEQSLSEKVWRLLVHDLPVGLVAPFEGAASPLVVGLLGVGVGAALYATVGANLLAAFRTLRARGRGGVIDPEDRRLLFFPVHGMIFLTGFLVTDFVVEPQYGAVSYRFFLPPAVLLLLAGSGIAARAWRAGGARRSAAAVLAGLFLLSSASGTLLLAVRELEEPPLMTVESGYLLRGLLLHRKFEGEFETALAHARRVEKPPLRSATLTGLGWGLLYRFEKSGEPEDVSRVLRAVPFQERARILSGIQTTLAIRFSQLDEAFARGEAREIDRHVYAQLEKLQGVADAESERVPANAWPLGGYRPPSAIKPPAETAEERGRDLYQFLGCAGCHERAMRPGQLVRRLDGLSTRHTSASIVLLLDAPKPPMPRFDLDEHQRQDLATYLLQTFP